MQSQPISDQARSIALTPLAWLNRTSAAVGRWQLQVRTRRHLSLLSDHLLDDIGLDRQAADEEIGKRFWQR